MKNFLRFSIAIFAVVPSLVWGQNIDSVASRDSRDAITTRETPVVEIRILRSCWRREMDWVMMTSIISQISSEAGFDIGANTLQLLEEIEERDTLTSSQSSRWIRQDSPRFSRQSLEPATLRFEVITAGSYQNRHQRVGLGSDSVLIESGSSMAELRITVRDLVSGRVLGVIHARGEARSTNLEQIDIGSRWSWRGERGFPGFEFETWDDPADRRSFQAIERCLENLRRKLSDFRETGKVSQR